MSAFNTCIIIAARRGGGRFAFKVGVAPCACGAVGGQDNRARNETGPSIILHFTRAACDAAVATVWAREFVFQFVCGETGSMSSRIGRPLELKSICLPCRCNSDIFFPSLPIPSAATVYGASRPTAPSITSIYCSSRARPSVRPGPLRLPPFVQRYRRWPLCGTPTSFLPLEVSIRLSRPPWLLPNNSSSLHSSLAC